MPTERRRNGDKIIMEYGYDGKSFWLNGERIWLSIAEIHYFRFSAGEWRRTLNIAKAAGFNTVSTYAAWNYHELEEGFFDFSGDKDVGKFIDIAKELGLYVIVRPGPYICAEWAGGGIPTWTMCKEKIENRRNNSDFISLTRKWFSHILDIVASRQVTKGGNVISVQNDNEYTGGWDKESADYITVIHDMIREFGIDVAITACNVHYKNNEMVINYGCGGDWKKLYQDILLTYNTAGESGVITQLKELQKDKPTIVTELWTGGQSYWGKLITVFPDIAKKMVDFTSLQTMVNLYMFQGGTNFGFYGSCDITTSYSSHYPVFESGLPRESYFDIKLVGAFLSTFGREIAAADFEVKKKGIVVQHMTDGDILYGVFDQEEYCFTYEGRQYNGSNQTKYIVTPIQYKFCGNTIDYTDLCLLAKHDNVMYLYGNAGESYTLSVNQKVHTILVRRHDIQMIEVGNTKIIVCDRYCAKHFWLMGKHEVLMGAYLAYRDGEDVIKPCKSENRLIWVRDGKIVYEDCLYESDATELPKLEEWQVNNALENTTFEKVDKPLAMHLHHNPFGYLWYKAEVECEVDKRTGMMITCYGGRILVYLNGRFVGIFGDTRNGGRMRYNYQKPADSLCERILLDLKKGRNEILFLAEDTGYSFDDIKPLGIMGDVYADCTLKLIEEPIYLGKTEICNEAREFLYSIKTFEKTKYDTISFDLNLEEDEIPFFMIQGVPCWITVNGENAYPVKQANKMWQLFSHTAIWASYEVKNARHHNQVIIQYHGDVADLIANMRIYVAKKDSCLTNWSVSKFNETVCYEKRADYKNIVSETSTLLVPGDELGGFASDYDPKYFTTEFDGDDYGPLFLDIGKMKKGQIYLNGHNLGRFNGKIPQELYYIPDAYLEKQNVLTVFEEYGICPQDVRLVRKEWGDC